MSASTSIRAAVMPAPDAPVEVRTFDRPRLEPGAILLETIYSEVCGTDVHLHHGHLAGVPYPLIPGHVSVGRVAETGGEVLDLDGLPLRTGDVITFLDVHETCGKCWYCTVAKASTRCPSRRVYGITYSADEGLLGGWAQAIYLKPGVKTLRLPANLPPERFIAAGCGLPTSVHAIERAEIKLGDNVVIQGSGPVGLNAVALAQLQGAGQVIVVGAPALRLEMATAMGADEIVDISRYAPAERVQRVKDLTGGRGADVTIEATGVPAAVREGMQMTRDAGRYRGGRPIHRRGRGGDQPALGSQPQAPGSARLLGIRLQPLLPRRARPRSLRRPLRLGPDDLARSTASIRPARRWTTSRSSRWSRR